MIELFSGKMDEFPNEQEIIDDSVEADSQEVKIRIQNIVASINLSLGGYRLDLTKIAQTARNAEYNPQRFAAVIMRIREPRTTGIILTGIYPLSYIL